MPRLRGPATGILIAVTFVAGVGVGRLEPFAASSGAPAASPDAAAGPTDDGVDDFGLVREAWDLLHEKYVGRDTLDDRELAYGAIDGLADAVGDTGHTDFMTPEERTSRNDALSGSYVGIGVQLDNTDSDEPRVVTVFHDSPADKAGLRTGDVILEVDGVPAAGSSLDDVVERIRGESGTAVELTVRTGEDGTPRTLKIVRGEVEIDAVSSTMIPGTTTGLLRIEQFSHRVAEDVQTALRELRKEGADRLVLDLRGNPGGYVGEAVGTASQFLSSGTVYVERNAEGEEKATPVSPDGVWTDLPLIVLVDEGSASSSEIVAGALQDNDRAKVVGAIDVRHRHGPRRVRARGRFGAAHRDRRVADPGRAAHLARGHRAGRRGGPGDRSAADAPRRRAGPRTGEGGVHRGRAARARAGAHRGGLTGQAACRAAEAGSRLRIISAAKPATIAIQPAATNAIA